LLLRDGQPIDLLRVGVDAQQLVDFLAELVSHTVLPKHHCECLQNDDKAQLCPEEAQESICQVLLSAVIAVVSQKRVLMLVARARPLGLSCREERFLQFLINLRQSIIFIRVLNNVLISVVDHRDTVQSVELARALGSLGTLAILPGLENVSRRRACWQSIIGVNSTAENDCAVDY